MKILLKYIGVLILVIFLGCDKIQSEKKEESNEIVTLSSVDIASNASNRGAAYLVTNKIIVNHKHVYCVYLQYDYSIVIVDYNSENNQIYSSFVIGKSVDNHGNPSICVDDLGYIYVAFGGHSQDYYIAKSVNPYNISEWKMELFSLKSESGIVRNMAYTDLHYYNGFLYMLCRSSSYMEGTRLTLVRHSAMDLSYINYSDIFAGYAKHWELEGIDVFEKNIYNRQYNFFRSNMLIDSKGVFHISFQTYEYMPVDFPNSVDSSGGKYYFIGYLKSADMGVNWTTYTGREIISLPCKPSEIDPIAGSGNPYDATKDYETSNMVLYNDSPYLLYHVYGDESELYRVKIGMRLEIEKINFRKYVNEDVECNSESSFMMDNNGNYIYALSLVNKEDYKSYNGFGMPSTKLRIIFNDKFVADLDEGVNWFPNFSRFHSNKIYFTYQNGVDASGCQIKLGYVLTK